MKVSTDSAKVGSVGLIEKGTASYYYYHDGKKTASGFPLDKNSLWVAYYPKVSEEIERNETRKQRVDRKNSYLGRKVRITCEGISVICTVEDCGDFRDFKWKHLNRVIDCSPGLFRHFKGTKKQGVLNVTVELL